VSKVIPIASSVPVDASNADGCGGTSSPAAFWVPGSARFRLSTAASGGGSTSNFKVYVSQCDAQNVAVINTYPSNSNPVDTYTGVSLASPLSASPTLQVSISGATQTAATSTTPATTTFTYTPANTILHVGMSVFVTGMTDVGNNGNFVISSLGSGTFTVNNPSGVTNTTQSGTGAVLPRQNPVFLVAGPSESPHPHVGAEPVPSEAEGCPHPSGCVLLGDRQRASSLTRTRASGLRVHV